MIHWNISKREISRLKNLIRKNHKQQEYYLFKIIISIHKSIIAAGKVQESINSVVNRFYVESLTSLPEVSSEALFAVKIE